MRLETGRQLAERKASANRDWTVTLDRARRALGTLGMQERSGEVDDFGLDEIVVARSRPWLQLLRERYWRIQVSGASNIPAAGPVLFVANRSGLLPYDGLMIAQLLEEEAPALGRARFLVADWLITLPFAQPFLARLGGVRACPENGQRLLANGRSVVAFPEGAKGATKVYRDRYRLQRFGRGGVVRLARASGVPVVPVAIVGAEEVHPVLMRSEVSARALGLPFVPVTPTFPWFGPLGLLPLPSKWCVEFGEVLDLGEAPARGSSEELLIAKLNQELRSDLQRRVDRLARSRDRVFS